MNFKQRIIEILNEIEGPVSIELTKTNESDDVLINEAINYFHLKGRGHVVIKVPMWGDGRGLRIAKELKELGIPVNMTCCMSVNQAILASLLEADYVSLFFNRIIDYYKTSTTPAIAFDEACQTIELTRTFIDINDLNTKIIAGSIRHPMDVEAAFLSGSHIVTIPPKILAQLPYHPKTEATIKEFDEAWRKFLK